MLLAWNTVVVIGLLTLFGLGITLVSQFRLRSEMDRDLTNQAQRAQAIGPLPNGPRPRGPGDVPERYRPLFGPALRVANLREPRFFDADGYSMRPPPHPGPPGRGPGPGPEEGGPDGPPWGQPPPRGQSPRVKPVDPDPEARQIALRGQTTLRTVQFEGSPVRVFTTPFVRGREIVGVLQTSRELTEVDELMQSQLITLAIFLPIAGLMAAWAAVTLANRALRPVAEVTRTASQIGGDDLSQRLVVVGDDELAELSSTFNGMLDRLQGAFSELNKANGRLEGALESQRRFTADASHELRTPLTRMRLAADSVRNSDDPIQLQEALNVAHRASEQMSRLVEQLLMLARVDAGQLPVRRESFDLRVAAAEAIEAVSGAEERVEAEFGGPVMVTADPDHIRRITINLVENAMKYAGYGARIWLRVNRDGDSAYLEVGDAGRGIPAEHIGRIFDRFHRVDEARSSGGSGLGLAICRDLARANGGDLTLESQEGNGTRVVLRIS